LALWCVLLLLCWPLAFLAALLVPFVWLISIPFRVAFWAVESLLACVKALLFLPARVLGARG